MAVTGETRTAILSDEQDVHLVTVGDRIGGYDIVEMTDHSVTLAEPSGLRWVLRMR
jgi:hypothetical protein